MNIQKTSTFATKLCQINDKQNMFNWDFVWNASIFQQFQIVNLNHFVLSIIIFQRDLRRLLLVFTQLSVASSLYILFILPWRNRQRYKDNRLIWVNKSSWNLDISSKNHKQKSKGTSSNFSSWSSIILSTFHWNSSKFKIICNF